MKMEKNLLTELYGTVNQRYHYSSFALIQNGAVFSDSPLVKTSISILAGFSISYFFWESQTLVEAEK